MEQTPDLKQILNIVKRRRHWLVWPFLSIVILTTTVALVLPNTYTSTATILIQNQQIPNALVPTTVTTYAEERIQTITQEVTGRTKLMTLVSKFDLMPGKREKLTTDDLVEQIRKRVSIQPVNAEINKEAKGKPSILTIAFTLSYQDQDPRKAQAVANEIASYYMEKNLESRERLAKGTTDFLEDQLKQGKARIDELEARRATFRETNLEKLPEFTALNMQKLEKLNATLSEIHMQIRSLEEQRTSLKGRLAMMDPNTGGSGRTMSPAERLQQARLEYAQLLSKYSDKHPLVQAKSQEIGLLEAEAKGGSANTATLQDQLNELESKLATLKARYSDIHPQVQSVRREIDRVKNELAAARGGKKSGKSERTDEGTNPAYVSLQSDLDRINVSITSLKAEAQRVEEQTKEVYVKLRASPQVAKEYNDMETDYQIAKAHYNEIQQKMLAARVSQGMEEEQLGEKFQVAEPAFLPEKPSKPNRKAIILIGVVLGMGFSVGAAALREFTDHTVRDSFTLQNVAGVEVLTVIPRIFTLQDQARRRKKNLALVTGVVASAVLAVLVFHFFVMDLDILMAKLERFIQRKAL